MLALQFGGVHLGGDDVPVRTPRVPAREAAERELSDPRYHQHDPNPLQRALNWLWQRVDDLFSAAAGATPGGWVGLLVIALVVLLLVVALRLRLGALRRTPTTGATLFTDRPRTAAEHRTAAEAHAARNDWTAAVQERMRAIVLALEERALLTPAPGRTADEAAAESGRAFPGHADRLRAAARTFDALTYGRHLGTAEEYARLSALDTDLARAKPELTTDRAGAAG
ncbi:DUF4129 domain-containing protein [Streptomyces sp. Ru73]|uniref:DUF4129 domain-containing protein n=1 Tax=Streptomyces sp. Ru73 TaxID=2080748 RepID=UPI0021566C0A|nr:DUF4129 domain-containing protein [Streptomyces sp. Ru73]